MKKSLSLVLALVFVLGIAGTAFAANPFVDVPAKHWSYDAVSKLVKAGIVDGYDDGTFRGDKTMTRYEMAQVVAKAMAKSDKADAANKALIEKLSAEYSTELNNLGVRVGALENKVNGLGNIKMQGEIRAQYNWDNGSADQTKARGTTYRLRLNLSAPIAEGWTAVGRIEAKNTASDNTNKFNLVRGYVQGPLFGANVEAGRVWMNLGKMYTGTDKDGVDGIKVTVGNQLKLTAGTVKIQKDAASTSYALNAAGTAVVAVNTTATDDYYKFAQLAYPFSKSFDMTAFYLKNNRGDWYKTWGVGFTYAGWDNLKLTAEYGKNTATVTNGGAKAWATRLAWNGADINKAQSWGTWVGYRSAETGYDSQKFSTLDKNDFEGAAYRMDNIKGWEIGFDYAPIKNVKFKTVYLNTTAKTDGADKHQYVGEVNFFF